MLLIAILACLSLQTTSFRCNFGGKRKLFTVYVEAPSDTGTIDSNEVSALKADLFSMISKSDRGKKDDNLFRIKSLVESLEGLQSQSSDRDMTLLMGQWDLLWADDDATRSSPFFWAFRKATRDMKDPIGLIGPEKLSESIFKITDSIPFKSIGKASQLFTDNVLKSEVEVDLGLPLAGFSALASSKMTTSSKFFIDPNDPDIVEITVEKTQVLQSTIEKLLPFQLPLLGASSSFPSGAALELLKPGSSTVYMRISYLDDDLRIARNEQDNKVFIYERASTW